MASYTFIACEDDPERGIVAGDVFEWEHDGSHPTLHQIRAWKNAACALELLREGVVLPLADAPPELLRQKISGGPEVLSEPDHLRLLK